MRLLLLLSILVVICQCRHLTQDRKDGRQKVKDVARKQWQMRKSLTEAEERTSAVYEPIVVKLEVHFARKRKKMKSVVVDTVNRTLASAASTTSSSSPGFIHLFLPFNLPAAASGATTFRPEMTQQASDKKKQSLKRRKKTKKKKKKKQQQQSSTPFTSSTSPTSSSSFPSLIADASVVARPSAADDVNFREKNHRLLPLLQDDGIPPLLNSLSSNETQQWARWLRCTLCLKNDKHSDKDSALCLHNVGCQGNSSVENELTASGASGCQDSDICSQWQNCENQHQIPSLFAALPPCPCTYPTGLVYNDRVWDPLKQQHYRWREISLESERVDIYRPGAAYCIRSLSVVTKLALAAQQCCYDQRRRLLTRGWATGTPALVSPEASLHLSRVTERIPWLACKGDFSRYHLQRPPDNRLNCSTNPSDEEFQRQVLLATNY